MSILTLNRQKCTQTGKASIGKPSHSVWLNARLAPVLEKIPEYPSTKGKRRLSIVLGAVATVSLTQKIDHNEVNMKPSVNEYDRLDDLRSAMWKSMSKLEQRHIANHDDPVLEQKYRQAEEKYYVLEKQCTEYRDLCVSHGLME